MKQNKGITLITLVITIILLIILAGVVINLALGENGLFDKTKEAKDETLKQAATEKINLKITNIQIDTYSKEQRMPTLQELADSFCEDEEIEYVELESKQLASLDKIEVGDNTSFFTKLKEYPYEFEINSSLQLASINGVKVATATDNLEERVKELEETVSNLQNTITVMQNENSKVNKYKSGTVTIPANTYRSTKTVNVTFNEPFENTNYSVVITSIYAGSYWAQSSYSVINKTVNGFTIITYLVDSSGSTDAHPVDWIAIPYNN